MLVFVCVCFAQFDLKLNVFENTTLQFNSVSAFQLQPSKQKIPTTKKLTETEEETMSKVS